MQSSSRRAAMLVACLLLLGFLRSGVVAYEGDWSTVYDPVSRTVNGVTGTITWGEYEQFSTSMEDNDNGMGTADWGGRLNLTLKPLEYIGSTDCTNDDQKKVWVEDGATCQLSLDDTTTHTTTFSCTGFCAGDGGCDFEYTSKVYGHWKGYYEGVDAKLDGGGSFTAICMAGKIHEAAVSVVSGAGNTTITEEIEAEVSGGQTHKGEGSAGGNIKGIDVKVVSGNEMKSAVALRRTIKVETKLTDAVRWDNKYLATTVYKLHMGVNQPPVERVRDLTWSWNQGYNAYTVGPGGTPLDTPIRRGNTEKIQWEISTPSYKIEPYCGVRPADQGYNPAGNPQDIPEIPAKGAKRTATLFVPGSEADEPFVISVVAGEGGIIALRGVEVAETGIVEEFTAVVTEFDETAGTAVIESTVPFMLHIEFEGLEYGQDTFVLTRTGGMPDVGEGYSSVTELECYVEVISRGFIVQELEGWPSGDVVQEGRFVSESHQITMIPASMMGLTIDCGAPLLSEEFLTISNSSSQLSVTAPASIAAGQQTAIIWLTAEELSEPAEVTILLNGRVLTLTITASGE